MIERLRPRVSLVALKFLLLGTIFFTVGAQIGFAMWGKYVIYSISPPARRRSASEAKLVSRVKIIYTEMSTTTHWSKVENSSVINPNLNTTTNTPPSATARTSVDYGTTAGRATWKTDDIDCSVRTNVTRSAGDKRKFKALPDKYETTLWPPVSRKDCGVMGLQRPWALDAIKNPWMIFIVKSAPHHYLLRNTIRSTWGSVTSFYGRQLSVIFLLGLPRESNGTNGTLQQAIVEENGLFGDILQCDLLDSYKNLPVKVLDSFQWMLKQVHSGSFYTVTDDDCLMRIPNIYLFFNHLNAVESRSTIYCGFLYDRDNKAIRAKKSKWSMSAEEYSASYYPTFCHGGMYTMKRPLMKSISCMAQVTNMSGFYLEDVLVTGILREKLGDGDSNIKPVTTKSSRKLELMYYPWDDNQHRALAKMTRKWASWNRTLAQYRLRNLITNRKFQPFMQNPAFQELRAFWKARLIGNKTVTVYGSRSQNSSAVTL